MILIYNVKFKQMVDNIGKFFRIDELLFENE